MRFSAWLTAVALVSLLAGPCDVLDEGGGAPVAPIVDAPVRGFVSVAVGGADFACGLRDGGSVGCWGSGPSALAPEGEFTTIAAGLQEMCGVRVGGEIHCWGGNSIRGAPNPSPSAGMMSESVLDDPRPPVKNPLASAPDRLLAESVPSGAFVAVGVGDRAACGVREGGGVVCWGPVGAAWEPPGGRFGSVSVGVGAVACGVRADESLACWGDVYEEWAPPVGRFGSVDVGTTYACGLEVSGEVVCWGPDPVVGPAWVQEAGGWSPPDGVFVDVALNDDFACGVRAGGEVQCWGPQGRHDCADGRAKCFGWDGTPIPPGPFTSVAVAKARSGWYTDPPQVCGIRAGGEVACWNDRPRVPRAPSGAFVDVNEHGSCGVRAGGEVVCWSRGIEYVMADGEFTAMSGREGLGCGLRVDGEITCWGDNSWGAASPPPGPFTAIDLTFAYLGCGLRPDGEAVCWGRTDRGQGDPPPGPFTVIEAEWYWRGDYACGLRADATAECWGPRAALQEIIPAEEFAPPDFANDPRWRGSFPGAPLSSIEVSRTLIGASTGACGIRPGGELVCWNPEWPPNHWMIGEFPRGVLGEPRPTEPDTPAVPDASAEPGESYHDDMAADDGLVPVCERRIGLPDACPGVPERLDWVQGDVAGGPYVALDSGTFETCGLRGDGAVDCWGNTPGSPDGQFASVEVGWSRAFGIRPDGELEWWMPRWEGLYEATPWTHLIAPPGRRFVALDSGQYARCGLLDDGTLLCTGDSPEVDERRGPFARFSVGGGTVSGRFGPMEQSSHVCAVRTDGDIECWGDNRWGQTSLTPWLDIAPYRDVASGFRHTCAIGAGGEVLCWGNDSRGQTQSPPGAFTAISAGFWHTCALRTDGEINCWGDGAADFDLDYNAPPPDRPTTPPTGPFTAVAAGAWHTCALRPDGIATCWLSY